MLDSAIHVDKLGKKYVIGHEKQERYTSFRDVLSNNAKSLVTRMRNQKLERRETEDFWVLKDVSFDIKKGDKVGIIGRNGAGKSTLLKILSRITEPTEGKIKISGRVASLLEVGTGFHAELTGRENIYLNGAILGMSKEEIKRKFDEIANFAQVEKFLDTPVKRYSSGMYVRLAFAVAAHLEPEILVVDEVLAVGDAQFQKKCLGKMEEVGKDGRTVLFVSHNIGSVKTLCNLGIVLDQGRIVHTGSINESIDIYNNKRDEVISHEYNSNNECDHPWIQKIKVFQNNCYEENFQIGLPINIYCEFANQEKTNVAVYVDIRNSQGDLLIHSSDEFIDLDYSQKTSQRQCTIPADTLNAGDYYVTIALLLRKIEIYQKLVDVIKFRVEFSGQVLDKSEWKGLLAPKALKWH